MKLRTMTAYDLEQVCRIDPEWSIEAWSPYVDYDSVDGEQYSARVLEFSGRVIAAMAYRWHSQQFIVHRVAVVEMCRRRGHGTQLVDYLKGFLHPERRRKITMHVDEYDLGGQLWLRSCGFACVRTTGGFLEMEFRIASPDDRWQPVNRISKVVA